MCCTQGGGGGGWQDKTPLQKYRAFQAYRNFLSREPPKALGSKEIPQVSQCQCQT